MISIKIDPTLTYPEPVDFFSPDERFPEYRYQHVSTQRNPVYRAVRDCFTQAGLDHKNFGTSRWNPLGEFITPENRVFVLCNFANERRSDELLEDFYSRCTHGSVLRVILDYVLIAVNHSQIVYFGNAPTQFCHWDAVLRDTGAQTVLDFYELNSISVKATDLRLVVTDATYLGAIKSVERRTESDGVTVRLGEESLFTELDHEPIHRYRVMNYNPNRTEKYHGSGTHSYVVNRKILESDVILSVPKFKTHEKVGMSCGLKGFVGTTGHKDSLPHHRYGTPDMYGDEYPFDKFGLLRLSSAFHEKVQQIPPDTSWGSFLRVIYKISRRVIRPISPISEGAWWGNNTAWRMVLDLAKIVMYASPSGEMKKRICRKHLVFIDGILGGEGDGPAFCSAIPCGYLLFSDNLVLADYVNAFMMGFDPQQIPLVSQAFNMTAYPLLTRAQADEQIIYNGQPSSIEELNRLVAHQFEPPPGWKEKLHKVASSNLATTQ